MSLADGNHLEKRQMCTSEFEEFSAFFTLNHQKNRVENRHATKLGVSMSAIHCSGHAFGAIYC